MYIWKITLTEPISWKIDRKARKHKKSLADLFYPKLKPVYTTYIVTKDYIQESLQEVLTRYGIAPDKIKKTKLVANPAKNLGDWCWAKTAHQREQTQHQARIQDAKTIRQLTATITDLQEENKQLKNALNKRPKHKHK